MPIDPSISLGIKPPTPPTNPLETVGTFMNVQNAINQNKLFQQTFAAKQRAGQILASSPDIDTGLAALLHDPVAGPFAGEFVGSIRQAQVAETQVAGERQKQAESTFGAVLKGLTGALQNPQMFDSIVSAQLMTASPSARQAVTPAIASLRDSLLDGLPEDPLAAKKMFQSRLAGLNLAVGITPETVKGVLGSPETVDTGGGLVPAIRAPVQEGGALSAAGPAISKTLAPTVVSGPYGEGGAEKATIIGGSQGNVLGLAIPKNTTAVKPSSPAVKAAGVVAGKSGGDGGGAGKLEGPPKEMVDYMQKVGGNMADLENDMNKTVSSLMPQMTRLAVERKALSGDSDNPGVQIGGWGESRAKLAQFLQGAKDSGVPITQKWIDTVGNKSLTNAQVFKALSATQSAAQYQQAVEGTGRGFQLEYAAFKDAYPNLSTDPDATEKIYNFIQEVGEKYYTMQQDLLQFKHQLAAGELPGYTISDFPAYENKKMFDNGKAFSQERGQAEGSGLKPKAGARKPLSSFFAK